MTATTALTAQNTLGVQDIHHIPATFVEKQIHAVCEDVGVDVVKTGEVELGLLAKCKVTDVQQACLHRRRPYMLWPVH